MEGITTPLMVGAVNDGEDEILITLPETDIGEVPVYAVLPIAGNILVIKLSLL